MSSLYDDCVEREQVRLNKAVRERRVSEKVKHEIEEHERVQREAMTGVPESHAEAHALTDQQQTLLWRRELGQEASIFTPPFNRLGMLANVPSLAINCTIGAAAGVGAQSILYPMEVVKTRVVVSKSGEYEGLGSVIREAYAQGGLLEFYKGFTPNLVGIVVYRGLEMGIYSSAQQSIMLYRMQLQGKSRKEAALTAAEVGTVGMVGSTVAQTISYPLNVVRTRLQTQGSRGREKKYKGMIDCMVKMVRAKGVRSLFSGITANYLKAVPASGVTFMVFEKVESLLVGEDD
ncbi:solute carrier family 25 (mitochondrial phosphate transporter), member 23/24/25/41 [Strigomonas culicis]|nr:solute carrier family 25 (mitochondrial phosphate transporter), member 23/24/25/41 [Strigomonas culicis]|eukprot:EPY24340.1 solute carrier family 25 (mitochondrial phosphate transporter), member 23/24/25/41 [Strigomonas culicis]